jgi:hypothetical protein
MKSESIIDETIVSFTMPFPFRLANNPKQLPAGNYDLKDGDKPNEMFLEKDGQRVADLQVEISRNTLSEQGLIFFHPADKTYDIDLQAIRDFREIYQIKKAVVLSGGYKWA